MPAQLVVGIFEAKGDAQNARNRLHTEGVPLADMALVVLHEIADPLPASTGAELAALSVDPLILGDVEKTFVDYIKNGETAVIVYAATANDVEFAADVLTLFAPLAIEVLPAQRGAEVR